MMNWWLIISFISIIGVSNAQDVIVESFMDQGNKTWGDIFYTGPWQSVVSGGGDWFSLDVVGTEEELARIDIKMVMRDLRRIYDYGYRINNLELMSEGYRVSWHTPIVFWPLNKRFNWIHYSERFVPKDQQTVNMGDWETFEVPYHNLVYMIKPLGGGQWQLSFGAILEFKGYVNTPDPDPCECLDQLVPWIKTDQLPDTLHIFRGGKE